VTKLFSAEEMNDWTGCVTFFKTNEDRLRAVRDDVGGHFGVAAAKYAAENLDRMEPGLIGLQLDRTDNVVNSSFRFKFAEQIAAAALYKQHGDLTHEAWSDQMRETIQEAFFYAGQVVGNIGRHYVWPRFYRPRNF
jgi:hypothetical protein